LAPGFGFPPGFAPGGCFTRAASTSRAWS
jgi:hypothetical protein